MLNLFQIGQNRRGSSGTDLKTCRVTQAASRKLYLPKLITHLSEKVGFVFGDWWDFEWSKLRVEQTSISPAQHGGYLGLYSSQQFSFEESNESLPNK